MIKSDNLNPASSPCRPGLYVQDVTTDEVKTLATDQTVLATGGTGTAAVVFS